MRCYLKILAATALIGTSIADAPFLPAFAAKPASQRHYTHNDAYFTPMPEAGAATTTSILRITRRDGARAAPFKLRGSSRLAIRASH